MLWLYAFLTAQAYFLREGAEGKGTTLDSALRKKACGGDLINSPAPRQEPFAFSVYCFDKHSAALGCGDGNALGMQMPIHTIEEHASWMQPLYTCLLNHFSSYLTLFKWAYKVKYLYPLSPKPKHEADLVSDFYETDQHCKITYYMESFSVRSISDYDQYGGLEKKHMETVP